MTADDGTLPVGDVGLLAAREPYTLPAYHAVLAAAGTTFSCTWVAVTPGAAAAWRHVYMGRDPALVEGALFQEYEALVAAVDSLVAACGPAGAFVRLSSRSPKDACDKLPLGLLLPILREELGRLGLAERGAGTTASACRNARLTHGRGEPGPL